MTARLSGTVGCVVSVVIFSTPPCEAQPVAETMNGVPQLIVPQVGEVGLQAFTIPTGTPSIGGAGSGGSGAGSGGAGGGNTGSGYDLLSQQSWGPAALDEAASLGVAGDALGSTCMIESACENIANGSGGSATGPFQMLPSTFAQMYAAALQDDPNLASTTLDDINDPTSEAAAAAEYMKYVADSLEANGVADPTFTQVRAGYAFGNSYAYQVATANPDVPLGQILTGWSASTWAANGLTPATTVGQWQQSVANKVGTAVANAPVLNG